MILYQGAWQIHLLLHLATSGSYIGARILPMNFCAELILQKITCPIGCQSPFAFQFMTSNDLRGVIADGVRLSVAQPVLRLYATAARLTFVAIIEIQTQVHVVRQPPKLIHRGDGRPIEACAIANEEGRGHREGRKLIRNALQSSRIKDGGAHRMDPELHGNVPPRIIGLGDNQRLVSTRKAGWRHSRVIEHRKTAQTEVTREEPFGARSRFQSDV